MRRTELQCWRLENTQGRPCAAKRNQGERRTRAVSDREPERSVRVSPFFAVLLGLAAILFGTVPAFAQLDYTVDSYDVLKIRLGQIPNNGTSTITLEKIINVTDDDLVISGTGKVITFNSTQGRQYFAGGNANPLLYVNGNIELTFDNQTEGRFDTFAFQRGLRTADGGSGNIAAMNGGGALSLWGSAAIPDTDDSDDADDADDADNAVSEIRSINRFLVNAEFSGNTAKEGTFTIGEDNDAVTYTTGGYGGAIFANHATAEFLGERVLFFGNSAEHAGGAIAAGEGAVFQFGSTRTGDTSTSVVFGPATINETGNSARRGGAIYASANAAFTFNGTTDFIGNYTELPTDTSLLQAWENGAGGAISAVGTSTLAFTGKTSFVENRALYGGAIDAEGGTLTFTHFVLFEKNEATEALSRGSSSTEISSADGGGALRITNGGTIEINHSATFIGNKTAGKGGAVFIAGSETGDVVSTLKLRATGGHIVFGNERTLEGEYFDRSKQNTAGDNPNSVYIGVGGVLDLAPMSGCDIRFYDPIDGAAVSVRKTDQGDAYYEQVAGKVNKTGLGAAWFYGDNTFEGDTRITEGDFIIAGEIRKKDWDDFIPGASYGVAGRGTFTVTESSIGQGVVKMSNGSKLSGYEMILEGGRVFIAAEVDEEHHPAASLDPLSTASIGFTNGIVLKESVRNDTGSKGGTFDIYQGVEFRLNQILSGEGQLIKDGGGTLVLQRSSNEFTGLTRVLRGAIQAYNDDTTRSDNVIQKSAGLQLVGTSAFYLNNTHQEIQSLTGEVGTTIHMERPDWPEDVQDTINNTLTINPGSVPDDLAEGIFNGTIVGYGNLQKLGIGAITLTSENTFSGGTFLGRGNILLGHERALGAYYGNTTTATTGLIFAREVTDGNDSTPKSIILSGERDRTLQNRFVIKTPDSPNMAITNTLRLDAAGQILTIAGNRTESDIVYTLPATSITETLHTGGGAFQIGSRGRLEFDANNPESLYVITDNMTTGNGGAFYAESSFELNPTHASVFIENNFAYGNGLPGGAAGDGGAIYLGQSGGLTMGTGTTLLANQAAGVGGAVYLTGGTNVDSPARSLIYADDPELPVYIVGNIAGALNTATKRYNSFYLDQYNELTFHAEEDCAILLYDPIESNANNSDNTVVKTGLGTLVLAGAAKNGYGYYGNTILSEGRTELESYAGNIAQYGQINRVASNTFQLDAGAVLAGWGEVRADQLLINGTLDVQTAMVLDGTEATFNGAILGGSGDLTVRTDVFVSRSVVLQNTLTGMVGSGDTLTVNANFSGNANIINRGAGTLVLNGDTSLTASYSGQTTGVLRVDAGTVAVGTSQRPSFLQADTIRVTGLGTLKVESQSLAETRTFYAGPDSTLSIGLRNPPVDMQDVQGSEEYQKALEENAVIYVSQTATIDGGSLDITGFAGDVEPEDAGKYLYSILYAEYGIVGDFSTITLAGQNIGTTGFATLVTKKSEDSRAYIAMVDYAWYAGNNTANGTFDIATEFTLGIDLKDVVPSGSQWDGKSLTKTGAGTLTLTGTNTYTGGTRILEGTLAGNERSLQGAINVGDQTTLHFNASTDGDFVGTLSGYGSVINDGTLALAGTHAFSGTFAVNGGAALTLSGKMQETLLTVEENGAFYGNATVRDLLVKKGGVFSAGDAEAVGETTVLGKLALKEEAIYQVHVAPDGSGDKTTVVGAADISNATLLVSGTAGSTADDYTQDQYSLNILSAEGGIKGTFQQSLTDLALSNYLADVYYADSVARLVLVNKHFSFLRDAWCENATEVGEAFDRINANSDYYQLYAPTLAAVRGLAPAERNAAMREVAGAVKANAHMLGQWDIARPTLERLELDRLDAQRVRGSLNNIWIQTFYEGTEAIADRNSHSFGISRPGFILGLDRRWTTTTVVGLTFGYSRPILQSKDDRAQAHDFQAGLYIGQVLPLGSELKGYFGFGGQGYETRRWLHHPALAAQSTRINGDYQGDSFDMTIELSRPFRTGRYGSLRPFAALDVISSTQGGHTETGDSPLLGEYARVHYGRAFVRLGARGEFRNDYASLWLRLAFALRFAGESAPETKYRFVSTPTEPNMVIRGVEPGDAYFQLGTGGHFDLNRRKTRQLVYGYDLSVSQRLTTYTGSLGFIQLF